MFCILRPLRGSCIGAVGPQHIRVHGPSAFDEARHSSWLPSPQLLLPLVQTLRFLAGLQTFRGLSLKICSD